MTDKHIHPPIPDPFSEPSPFEKHSPLRRNTNLLFSISSAATSTTLICQNLLHDWAASIELGSTFPASSWHSRCLHHHRILKNIHQHRCTISMPGLINYGHKSYWTRVTFPLNSAPLKPLCKAVKTKSPPQLSHATAYNLY